MIVGVYTVARNGAAAIMLQAAYFAYSLSGGKGAALRALAGVRGGNSRLQPQVKIDFRGPREVSPGSVETFGYQFADCSGVFCYL